MAFFTILTFNMVIVVANPVDCARVRAWICTSFQHDRGRFLSASDLQSAFRGFDNIFNIDGVQPKMGGNLPIAAAS